MGLKPFLQEIIKSWVLPSNDDGVHEEGDGVFFPSYITKYNISIYATW